MIQLKPAGLSFVVAFVITIAVVPQACAGESFGLQPVPITSAIPVTAVTSSTAPTAATVADPGYLIGPEDVLEISVWKEEGLRKEALVRPDGAISFPLVGEIVAAGRSAEQIRQFITDELRKSINDPVVSVSVLKVVGNRIYVIGRVNKPGDILAGRYIDVLQALSMAGGLTPYAAENDIKVLRRRNGIEEVYEFRYADIRHGRKLEQNITLQGGDVVLVP